MTTKTQPKLVPFQSSPSSPSGSTLPEHAANKLADAAKRAEASVARMRKKVHEQVERATHAHEPEPQS